MFILKGLTLKKASNLRKIKKENLEGHIPKCNLRLPLIRTVLIFLLCSDMSSLDLFVVFFFSILLSLLLQVLTAFISQENEKLFSF